MSNKKCQYLRYLKSFDNLPMIFSYAHKTSCDKKSYLPYTGSHKLF